MVALGHDEDREIILSSASELNDYLDSEVLLWRLSNSRWTLTPGNLLLSLARTQRTLDAEISQARETILTTVYKRRVAWGKKIQKEFPMRINQWQIQIEDYQELEHIDKSYVYNVRVRVILSLLIKEEDIFDVVQLEKIKFLDARLKRFTVKGEFLWDAQLMEVFPEEDFSYLYLDISK